MKDTLKLRYQTVSSWNWIICIATRFEKELVWSYIFTSVPLPPRTPHPPLSIPLFHLGLPVTLLASHRLFRHHTATPNTNNDVGYSATHDIGCWKLWLVWSLWGLPQGHTRYLSAMSHTKCDKHGVCNIFGLQMLECKNYAKHEVWPQDTSCNEVINHWLVCFVTVAILLMITIN